jgi:hypothetical protein
MPDSLLLGVTMLMVLEASPGWGGPDMALHYKVWLGLILVPANICMVLIFSTCLYGGLL